MARDGDERTIIIGILALQGAFVEHQTALRRLSLSRTIDTILVRTAEDLDRCDALIIPGGESTTIALLARLSGIWEPLKAFAKIKPVWGTCAGAILLSQAVEGAKRGGQELLGAMSITIARNGWGSQVESFEADLQVDGLQDAAVPFTGIFIRAPVILALTPSPSDPPIFVIAHLSRDFLPEALASPNHSSEPKTFVALRQGLHFLTTFHPELTFDDRFHDYFVRESIIMALALWVLRLRVHTLPRYMANDEPAALALLRKMQGTADPSVERLVSHNDAEVTIQLQMQPESSAAAPFF